ncbi:ribosomal-protein-alanine N-acetyltransferase [Leekyejoonella antrihumi]|uniref:[Ribosomal protein bS18]-alanine N-acetyltransferase n=2 Tax=Leekyejoonella antrihumi TaxID=1660198 RepID=A0A563E220_9MICO|nr:ribosomal-protein-alanine N-acetyltransferase [Leekyejoonella antrihumi]
MRWTDIEQLAELEGALFPGDAWNRQSWWSELAHRPRRRYAVAEVNGQLAGYAGLDCAGEVADVMTIAVAPGQQGRGLGQRMLDWLLDQARDSGAEAVLLEVRADNDPARALYDRNGFEQIRVRRHYYQPGGVDALVLRTQLTEVADVH